MTDPLLPPLRPYEFLPPEDSSMEDELDEQQHEDELLYDEDNMNDDLGGFFGDF